MKPASRSSLAAAIISRHAPVPPTAREESPLAGPWVPNLPQGRAGRQEIKPDHGRHDRSVRRDLAGVARVADCPLAWRPGRQ